MSLVALMFFIPADPIRRYQGESLLSKEKKFVLLQTLGWLMVMPSGSNAPLGRCFNNESHDKNRNRDGATEVCNVRMKSFHAVSVGRMSLQVFFWPEAKA